MRLKPKAISVQNLLTLMPKKLLLKQKFMS